ncbi:MAG TPA: sigma-54 dependent transcriptional regulator [bacterium]|nr:sigma-54 dependent transcriptional regulator [bacterium]HPN42253.1 sigma-54 dependent transcriptional regulator [bacterium]
MPVNRPTSINENMEFESWRAWQKESGILGNSEPVRRMLETIAQVAATDISVLISGESGTGKELVARAVHLRSKRHDAPLITVNCGAIPEGILESELFGHEKGSFTGAIGPRKGYFELADTGSIFLDEIGELPTSIQVKLLRVLENREFLRVGGSELHKVNVRFIAATNRDLEQEVHKGNFREDLFYRLNAIHIHVPALRERREDIPLLAKKFAADFCRENLIEFEGFTEDALFRMQDYHWPGNIRELKNIVEQMIVLERGRQITEHGLEKYIKFQDPMDKRLPVPLQKPRDEVEKEFLIRVLLEIKSEIAQLRELIMAGSTNHYRLGAWRGELTEDIQDVEDFYNNNEQDKSVADMEREMIRSTLIKSGWNKRKAAKILGLSERTLYRKINQYRLRDDDF